MQQQYSPQPYSPQQYPVQQYPEQPLYKPPAVVDDMIFIEMGEKNNKKWIVICSIIAVFMFIIMISSANKILSRTGQASGSAFEVTDVSTTTYKRTGGTKTNTRYSYRVSFTAPKPVSGTDTGSNTVTDTGSNTVTDTGSNTGTDTGSNTGTDTGSNTVTDTYTTTTLITSMLIKNGDPVIVYYNPNDPNDNSDSGDWFTMSFSGIGLGLSVTIAWLCSNCLSKKECNAKVGKRGFLTE